MSDEQLSDATENLVRSASSVLEHFKSGMNPTFDMLSKLEGALFPFTNDNLCGHRIVEECDCGPDHYPCTIEVIGGTPTRTYCTDCGKTAHYGHCVVVPSAGTEVASSSNPKSIGGSVPATSLDTIRKLGTKPWGGTLEPCPHCAAGIGMSAAEGWHTNGSIGGLQCTISPDSAFADLAAVIERQEKRWLCFHCGFETQDHALAAAHFGDRDDAEEFKPLCLWWARMAPEERGDALQDVIVQLNQANEEGRLRFAENQRLSSLLADANAKIERLAGEPKVSQ